MAREAFLLIVIAALAAVSVWSHRTKELTVVVPDVATVAPGASRGEDAAAPAAPAAVGRDLPNAPSDHSREIELPDGTFAPALNGAVDPAPLRDFWGSQVPWSPIVGVVRNDKGVDWYQHANGSCSTTEMVLRGDRYVAMTRVGHRGPAVTPPVGR